MSKWLLLHVEVAEWWLQMNYGLNRRILLFHSSTVIWCDAVITHIHNQKQWRRGARTAFVIHLSYQFDLKTVCVTQFELQFFSINNCWQLGSSTVPFAPNLGRVYSTVRICPKSSSKRVTSFVLFVPANNRRMSSEYNIPHRIRRLFWTSTGMND